jgi:hypothetical protein
MIKFRILLYHFMWFILNLHCQSHGMLHRVALLRTDVSEELIASIIRVKRIGDLGKTLAVTNNRRTLRRNIVPSSPIIVTLMMDEICLSETSVLTRATRRNILHDGFLHSHSRENLKFYKLRRMVSSGLLRGVALVRTDVSEEPGASFIRVTKIGERRTDRRTLRRNTIGISSQRTSVVSCTLCCS